jgi:hypothetical protein
MSEDERQRWREQMERQMGEPGGSGAGTGAGGPLTDEQRPSIYGDDAPQTDDMDLRGDEQSGERVAEWISDQPLDPDALRRGDAPSAESVRRAREAAERAVDESAVPPRYHRLIKRYFGKFRSDDAPSRGSTTESGSASGGDDGSSSASGTQGDS